MGPFSAFSHTQQIIWRVESRLQFATTLPLTYVRESGTSLTTIRRLYFDLLITKRNIRQVVWVYNVLIIDRRQEQSNSNGRLVCIQLPTLKPGPLQIIFNIISQLNSQIVIRGVFVT